MSGTQFGFQKHKFSTDAVLHLIEALQENFHNLKISVAIIIDLAKAFNSKSPQIFIRKILVHGCLESVDDLFASIVNK